MNTNAVFDFRRFYLLIRNVLILNRTTILINAGAVAGIALFISGIKAFQGDTPNIHQKLYVVILFGGGFLITGRIFKELHHKERGSAWLMIPASVLEKFTSRLFLSTIGYIAGSVFFWFLFSVISEGLNWLLFKETNVLFNPFNRRIMRSIAFYVVLQSPFLVGAVYFRKLAIGKTILVLIACFVVVLLVVVVGTKLVFWNYFNGLIPTFEAVSQFSELAFSFNAQIVSILRMIGWGGRLLFWGVIAPLGWIIGYYRLKETEV